MKNSIFLIFLLAANWLGSSKFGYAQPNASSITISYDYAGLTHVSVGSGRLRFIWHTERESRNDKDMFRRGSMADYDRHEVNLWLTEKEEEKFTQWVATHKIFSFAQEYPSASQGQRRASAFHSNLDLKQGEKSHRVRWFGDSTPPAELSKAVSEIYLLAQSIEKDRRDKQDRGRGGTFVINGRTFTFDKDGLLVKPAEKTETTK